MTFFGAAGVGLVKMMSSNTSNELRKHLCDFVQGQEKAFEPVARQLSGLIYHTALRGSGDHSCAEEVVQTVLVQISRKAAKLAKHPEPLAWVHEVSRLETLKFQRGELRRKKREEKAMNTPEDKRSTDPHLLAELDESMKILKDSERELILMKYFQGQTFSSIAAETGRSESAEKMRLKRALEKMAGWFGKKGVTLSVAGLTTVLSTEMGKAAPVGVGSATLGGVAVGAGSGKVAIGIGVILVAGFGIPISKKWVEVDHLDEQRTQLLEKKARDDSGRRREISARSGRDRVGIRLELTEEEWNMPLKEFAWRYQQAASLRDKIAIQKMSVRLESLGREELAVFCGFFGRILPGDLRETIWKLTKNRRKKLEFLIEIGGSGSAVRSSFQSCCWESLPDAAQWLIESEKRGGIEPVGHSDYRAEIWEELEERVRGADHDKLGGKEGPAWLEELVELAPEKNKETFEMSLLKLEGGSE